MTKPEGWIDATAVVTECRFQFARLNTLSLGIQRGEKFLIAFDFYVEGRLISGDFQSSTAIPQGERIPLAYNPADPTQNTRSNSASPTSAPIFIVGIIGSILLSFIWLTILRGCH